MTPTSIKLQHNKDTIAAKYRDMKKEKQCGQPGHVAQTDVTIPVSKCTMQKM